jgi:hypothetical protein
MLSFKAAVCEPFSAEFWNPVEPRPIRQLICGYRQDALVVFFDRGQGRQISATIGQDFRSQSHYPDLEQHSFVELLESWRS